MKRILVSASVLAISASGAMAGGIDRSGQNIGMIFKEGSYAEFSFGSVSPTVSGTSVAGLGGFSSGNSAEDYNQFGVAVKHAYANGIDVALIFDQPFGADVAYPEATGYFGQGATATLDTTAITGIISYTMENDVSVFGGLRYQTMEAEAEVPFVALYEGSTDSDSSSGYLFGAAYERKDIALRVALTYNSAISHDLETAESSLLGDSVTDMEVITPQSVNLDFQSGVAEDTLVFGSVRWVEWSEFDITPEQYFALTGGGSLVAYDDDTLSWTLGVGRRINENFAGAVSMGYEKANGGFSSNLGPRDGDISLGVGGTYTSGNMEITAGVRYVWIGDAKTTLDGVTTAANFTDNDALGIGLKVGFFF